MRFRYQRRSHVAPHNFYYTLSPRISVAEIDLVAILGLWVR